MKEVGRGLLGMLAMGVAAVALLWGAIGFAQRVRSPGASLVIGSKAFSESWVLAEIYAQCIERRTAHRVRRRHALGGTLLAFEGLKSGAIDLYPEYTGTGLVAILGQPVPRQPALVLPTVRREFEARFSMQWLPPQAFNNTYALAMRREHAVALGIERVSQLRSHPDLVAGFATEFVAREDGWPGLSQHYGLSLDSPPRALEAGLMYQAVASEEVDIISAYATDARMDKFDLQALEDDLEFFPPYRAAPLLAPGVAARHPEIVTALAPLVGRLTTAQMRALNGQVDIGKRDPADVAREYLDSIGL